MNFFGFGKTADIEIFLNSLETRKHVQIENQRMPIFYDGETLSGKVEIKVIKGKKLEHHGLRIEFYGLIEMPFDRDRNYQFITVGQELSRPGIISEDRCFPFEFRNIEKPYESYMGYNVNLRYVLKVTVIRRLANLIKDMDILVHSLSQYANATDSFKMEVGIEDCLHLEFEYNKSKYHLSDIIVGKIYFILVRVKIKYMEIQIMKNEVMGVGPFASGETEVVAKYQIMDGAPARGESIPIRLFLGSCDQITPTMVDIGHRFSVKYFLNLVLVDDEDRRYFKQQSIFLYRRSDRRPVLGRQMSLLTEQALAMGFASPKPLEEGIVQGKGFVHNEE